MVQGAGIIQRGIFGRNHDGRNTKCERPPGYDGCCESEHPDTLYARIQTPAPGLLPDIDIYTNLYKYTEPPAECLEPDGEAICDCGPPKQTDAVRYISNLIQYSMYTDDEMTVCCLAVIWEGVRDPETNECAWTLTVHNPSTPFSVSYLDTGAACDGSSGGHTFIVDSSGSQCIVGGISGFSDLGVTISDTVPGGTAASACSKLCCGLSPTLYLTLDIPGCDSLDEQVIELKYYDATPLELPGFGATINSNGEHTQVWRGLSEPCACNGSRIYFEVFLNTWSEDGPQCRWMLSVNQDDCYNEVVTENDNSFCPTVNFSGTLDASDTCTPCCPSGTYGFSAVLNR